ncbi:MAG: AAA family ATPase [Gemmatimonadetes bacterium]|nr:AAA family ATPase [Gemmatimonadota bacterium]
MGDPREDSAHTEGARERTGDPGARSDPGSADPVQLPEPGSGAHPEERTDPADGQDLAALIRDLGDPAAYPQERGPVTVHQTHISVVFLTETSAYKLKKAVDLAFLDFRTLESRKHFCDEEVRLNRRLAPDVYLGVLPVTRGPDGYRIGGEGEPVEYVVHMRRLPADATLLARVERDEADEALVARVARRIAAFHLEARGGADVAEQGRLDVVARNARENFEQTEAHVGRTVHASVFARVKEATEAALSAMGSRIEARAQAGIPRDTHGDLHLDHVYVFPEREPPADLAIIDCVEFNRRFRWADPVADMAFLAMDLAFRGRGDLAAAYARAWFTVREDPDGEDLVPFYLAYRAVVRAKVEGILAADEGAPGEARTRAALQARAHWLLALLAPVLGGGRPAVVGITGRVGSGKSTLARALAEAAGLERVSSDRTRKALAGIDATTSAAAPFGAGLYSDEWNRRTYEACLEAAERILVEGGRVVVDASFREDRWRTAFLERARTLGVPALFLHCTAPADEVRGRLRARSGDPSDADVAIYEAAAARWEDASPFSARARVEVPTGERAEVTAAAALEVLVHRGLAEPARGGGRGRRL